MNAQDILQKAASHMAARAKQYDKAQGERSVPAVVEAFNAVKGIQVLNYADGWLFLALLKLVRAQTAGVEALADSVEDATAYAALFGEEMLQGAAPFKVGIDPGRPDGDQATVSTVARGSVFPDSMLKALEALAGAEAERLRKRLSEAASRKEQAHEAFERRVKEVVLPPADAAHGARKPTKEIEQPGLCPGPFGPCLSGSGRCPCDPLGLK